MAQRQNDGIIDDVFADLEAELQQYAKMADETTVHEALEAGAKAFTEDLNALPYPISDIRKPGYTHMVDAFSYADDTKHKGQIVAGWGKYYGMIVEHGSKFQKKQPHLVPLWNKHEKEYYRIMVDKIQK